MKQNEATKKQTQFQRQDDGSWVAKFGEFTIKSALQPIFRFQNGKLRPVAFECLLRPFFEEASVLTGSFFSSLSKSDEQHLETIARTLHIRNAANLPKTANRLFINFNPSMLESKSTFEKVLQDLGTELLASGLTPTQCVCEITEKAARSKADLTYFVYSLRSRGYLIAVDDFGAESSDMKRIKELTPDIVKLDGMMIKNLMSSPAGYTQLKKLIENFQALRINTVLEGLEEMWQIEMAESAGADMVQGFAAAVPRIPPANFSEWFKDEDSAKITPLLSRPATG